MTVTVYSTPTCPWCTKLKDWLKSKKIPFKDINVQENEKARDYITNKSGQTGVPQTEVNGKIIVGFDPEAIEKALKK